jgi:signal transduction histidine kinase
MLRNSSIGWLSRLQVQQKIAWGYALALGVAITGTTLGIAISDYEQRQADAKATDALEELELIMRLQTDMLQTVADHEQLRLSLDKPKRLNQRYAKTQEYYKRFQDSWQQFKQTEGGTKGQKETEDPGEAETVEMFLEEYGGVAEAYLQAIEQVLVNFNPTTASPQQIAQLKTRLLQLEQSDLIERIDAFSEELTEVAAMTRQEYADAHDTIQQSTALRFWIIEGSMAASVLIALGLSILTSRAIAQPIQSLTRVTQQALNTSNFQIQAPVTTKDEVGTLAVSFNQLIASIKTLLDEQHQYSQTLELKVAERTHELSDKNHQLEALLKQLNTTQMQMVQSEKMSSLGQLVAGIAHEINNPINFIHGNLTHVQQYSQDLLNVVQLYQTHHPTPVAEIETQVEAIDLEFLQDDLPKLLDSMKMGSDRIREIVISLRNFSRLDQAEFKTVDLHEGIDSTLLILQHRLKAKPENPEINLIREYGDLPAVECYPGQLNQVLMNILANAIDALEESNRDRSYQDIKDHPNSITIRTSILDAQQDAPILNSQTDPRWVEIGISDNGSGMPEAIQTQIFNPFFTTKPVGKGTGMGMAISHQIITETHKGRLECCSKLGEGTTFMIQIPVQQARINKQE